MSKNKDSFRTCFKNVVLAGLLGLPTIMVCYLVLGAAMEYNTFEERSVALAVVMGVVNAAALYILHFRNHIYTYAEHGDKFSVMAELKAYIRGEGKYFLWIYGLCALASEIDMLIPRETVGRPVATVCGFALNLIWGYVPVPVVRNLLALLYSFGMVCLLAVLRSRKVYLEDRSKRRIE